MNADRQSEIGKLIRICHANLHNSKKCLSYLENTRGFSKEVIDKYKLGFFPQNIERLTKYVDSTTLKDLKVIDYSEKTSGFSEYFYLIFPIFSEYKEPVGIGGRCLLDADQRRILGMPKYKNSSFKKSSILYGLDKSRSSILTSQNVYVVEGYFDHIALDSNGIKNSVAICGTAFSKTHMLKLARYTDKITFILDRDDGGINSMRRIEGKYSNKGLKLRFCLLPESCKDVDDYFSNGGTKESFYSELEEYIPGW